jgi:hypothetical protein
MKPIMYFEHKIFPFIAEFTYGFLLVHVQGTNHLESNQLKKREANYWFSAREFDLF